MVPSCADGFVQSDHPVEVALEDRNVALPPEVRPVLRRQMPVRGSLCHARSQPPTPGSVGSLTYREMKRLMEGPHRDVEALRVQRLDLRVVFRAPQGHAPAESRRRAGLCNLHATSYS